MRIELLNGKDIENRIKTIATAGKLSRTKGDVFDVLASCDVYEKNLGLVNRIIGMGHKSIMEHDYFVFALGDVSPIIEQTIISYRLTSFTIKSGREVDFRNVGYYIPTFKDKNNNLLAEQDKLVKKYKKHMDYLFNEYGRLVDAGVKEEDARFVLPYSFHTNIIMGLDARELERMVNDLLYGKLSKYDELKELGLHLYHIIEEYIPYLIPHINEEKNDKTDWYDKYRVGKAVKTYDKVKLVYATPKVDDTILESAIMYHEQVTRNKAKTILKNLVDENPNVKEEMMEDIKNSLEQRELEQVNFQFEIPISLIVLKHLTRHRMHSMLIPTFTPMWNLKNYQTPPSVKKVDEEHYREVHKINEKMYQYFKKHNVRDEDLIYFYLCGHFVNVVTTMNGRTLEWISRMRCCTKAQWEIRNIAREMVKQVQIIAPLYSKCLGATCDIYGYCPEGKESCGRVKCEEK